jgi:hypothetical protein
MHDCRKTKPNLIDLVFGEMDASQQQRALAEVRNCPACLAEYNSMQATLRMFDQAADAAMPEESYWAGYEARLRAKLNDVGQTSVCPSALDRLKSVPRALFAFLLARPAIPATVAALMLLVAISAVWFSKQETREPQVLVASTTPTPTPTPAIATPTPTGEVQPEPRSTLAVKLRQPRRTRPVEQAEETIADTLAVADPATHLENAQLLLRAFRNAEPANLAYEKRQARKLVFDNILLRREAEAKGNLPVEEALNSLEPLLLDIANLPAKASRSDVQMIRERIQKQEIIATLQIVGTGAERFGAPALNQE